LIKQINFRHNLIDPNPPLIKYSNSDDGFNIKLEVNGKQNHEFATFWLLDNFIYSIVSSVDICSFIVGTLFNVPDNELYPDGVRDHLNKKNQNNEISKLFTSYLPPLSNPNNHLQTGRNIWNNAKHSGLHAILKVSHNLPDLELHWDGVTKFQIDMESGNITTVGTVDGKDVSGLCTTAEAVTAVAQADDYLKNDAISENIDGGTNTTLNIISNDDGESVLRLYGANQGSKCAGNLCRVQRRGYAI